MKTILFQGDSITDASRNREISSSLGTGYANYVAAELGADMPYRYKFYNRGISGNRVVDLYARIKQDMINLKPDVMSILIGVNDVWHEYSYQNGVSTEKFEMVYDLLLQELLQALPQTRIMILEPFVLPGSKTENTEEFPNRWDFFSAEVPLGLRRRSGSLRSMACPLCRCRRRLTRQMLMRPRPVTGWRMGYILLRRGIRSLSVPGWKHFIIYKETDRIG